MERLILENAINRSRKLAERHRWNSENTKLETSDENANEVYKNTCIQYANQEEQYAEWLEELKSYKDLEEQGLFVRLPCKVGDTLYCIDNGIVELLIVNSFRIYNFNRIEIDFENASGFTLCTFSGELDEGYFLTYEEAEKKLEELKK
jgi:hypothetical protein